MLQISREGTKVVLQLSTTIGWTFSSNINCIDEPYAILLSNNLRDNLWETIKKIREDAYNLGWSDKTKRKPKKDWFNGNINSVNP